MKTLTDCHCVPNGGYKTPWCEMLNACELQYNVLHLYYKLSFLQEEIDKRSSYLGKLRRTEEAQHLLDLIRMSKDEENLFYPFAKEAMADVFDAMSMYAPQMRRAFLWREGRVTHTIPDLPKTDSIVYGTATISKVGDKAIGTLTFTWADGDPTKYLARVLVKVTITTSNGTRSEEVMCPATYDTTNSYWSAPISYTPNLDTYETFVSADSAEPKACNPYFIDPVEFKKDDWLIDSDNHLFMALADGNVNEMPTWKVIYEPNDYRESIHYLLAFPRKWNLNMAEPLDTAIFEALVARIIFKWLQYSYPAEAERYLAEWQEGLEKIRRRCSELYNVKIVNRIPRMY